MAQPPFTQTSDITAGLEIANPKNFYRPINTNLTLRFHVFNSSGYQVTDADCLLHMYNGTGDQFVEVYLQMNPGEIDYYYQVSNTLFKVPDTIGYIVQCNNTEEAGFISSSFFTSVDGTEPPEDLTPAGFLVFIPLFLAALCIIIVFALGDLHAPLKLFLMLLSFVSVSVSYNYMIQIIVLFYRSPALQNFVASDYAWYGWVIYIVIIYFVIFWITRVFNFLRGKKEDSLQFK